MIFARINNQHLAYLQKRGKLFYEKRTLKFKQKKSGEADREAASMASVRIKKSNNRKVV